MPAAGAQPRPTIGQLARKRFQYQQTAPPREDRLAAADEQLEAEREQAPELPEEVPDAPEGGQQSTRKTSKTQPKSM